MAMWIDTADGGKVDAEKIAHFEIFYDRIVGYGSGFTAIIKVFKSRGECRANGSAYINEIIERLDRHIRGL